MLLMNLQGQQHTAYVPNLQTQHLNEVHFSSNLITANDASILLQATVLAQGHNIQKKCSKKSKQPFLRLSLGRLGRLRCLLILWTTALLLSSPANTLTKRKRGKCSASLGILFIRFTPTQFLCPLNIRVIPRTVPLHVGNVFRFNKSLAKFIFCVRHGHQMRHLAFLQVLLERQERSGLKSLWTDRPEFLRFVPRFFLCFDLLPLVW